ncbi:hypothetical protein [Paracoccus sp. SSK6]|uniref:hypothetical protein n=1 Tax=Paracoccus sp. SSK6 TaxID=3143131 RepID=UPI0032191B06
MASLADDLIGEIRLRRVGGRAPRESGLGQGGRRRSEAGGSSFSARARNLWRVGQGLRTWEGGIRQFLIDEQCDPDVIETIMAHEKNT